MSIDIFYNIVVFEYFVETLMRFDFQLICIPQYLFVCLLSKNTFQYALY